MGLTIDDFRENDTFDYFPENETSVLLFYRVCNQWRCGANGPFALDYNVIFSLMDLMKIEEEKKLSVFDDIAHMEQTAIDIILERR